MLFKSVKELRKYLIKERKFRRLWQIQEDDFPLAKAGTLSRIINDPAYEPQHKSVRDDLLLADACPRCHRKSRQPRSRPEGSPCRGCAALKKFRAGRKRQTG